MGSIVDFIASWKDLIVKVFGEHPLAAALVTLVAVAVFVALDRGPRKGKRPSTLLMTLGGWAVAVPILGFVMTVLGKLWAFVEKAVPFLAGILGSVYKIYEKHPLIVLVLICAGVIGFFVWKWWRPNFWPNRGVRVVALAAAVVLAVHIVGPIADLLPSEARLSDGANAPASAASAAVRPTSASAPVSPGAAPASAARI